MTLYGCYEINPENHQVANPNLAAESYLLQGLRNLLNFTLIGGVVSATCYMIVNVMLDHDIGGILGILLSVVFFTALILLFFAFPYGLYCGLRSLFTSALRVDASVPEKILKVFLLSVRGDMEQRAWNMLTDQAKTISDVSFPVDHPAAQGLPQPAINDLDSFRAFWGILRCRDLVVRWRQIKRRDIDARTVLLTCPCAIRHPAEKGKIPFSAHFVLVQRQQSKWFVANSFIWPVTEKATPLAD